MVDTDGNYFDVTGTTGFSAMTVAANRLFALQFDGALTMTHGASLNLPGGANITTAAGDEALCFSTAADTVRVISYTKASGLSIAGVNEVSVQVFTSNGTYTKPSDLLYAIAEVQAGGGGGGGIDAAGRQASGGGAGGYARELLAAGAIGATETVTIGAVGTAGANTGTNGGTGGTTSFGALLSATGGAGGAGATSDATRIGGDGGIGSGGDFNAKGQGGGFAIASQQIPGWGGDGYFAGGGKSKPTAGAGDAGTLGGGGSGAGSAGAAAGGAGGAGIIIVTEFKT